MKSKPIFITLLAMTLMTLQVAATNAQGEAPACGSDPCPTEAPTLPVTDTPTSTEEPPTPTATPTATPTSRCADSLEPNDEAGLGAVLIIDQPLGSLTLSPLGDNDYFQLWVKAGRYYQITTATPDGVDTRLHVFTAEGALIAENDDYRDGDPASRVKFQALVEGWVVVVVDSVVPMEWGCRRYHIVAVDVSAPTATPTATSEPTQTPRPEATPMPTATPPEALYDAYEPNYDFDTAANIGIGQTLSLNFQPYPPGHNGPDNDFFRVYVKVGQELRLETLELAPGLDTNLILYRENGDVINGNDDCQPGERRSCLTWSPDYTGIAYLLIGPVGLVPKSTTAAGLAYTLQVNDLSGQEQSNHEAAPTPAYGEPLPWSPAPTILPPEVDALEKNEPIPPATPEPVLHIQTFSLAAPTPTPPPLQPIVVQLTIYYDENDNKAPDSGEGVAGINVRVLDSLTNRLIGQAFTNTQGHTTLFVSAPNGVRLSVGYLGYSQTVRSPGGQFAIRIPPLHLPSLIP